MIPDDRLRGGGALRDGGNCSRRAFLGLLAGVCAAGGLAGCASASTTLTSPARTPTAAAPLAPSQPIMLDNAAQIIRLARLGPISGRARGVAWSPDGRLVASGSYRDLSLWEVATGQRLANLSGHTNQIYSLAWSPANNLLASASNDGTVRIWDVQQRRALQKLEGGSFFSLTWSPDGHQIAAGTSDGSVLLWNAETGKHIATWNGPAQRQSRGGRFPFAVWGVSWSPDGRHIVSTRYDDLLLIWDVATGASRAIPKTDTQPNTVAWAPSGQHFALTDDQGKVILWNGVNAQRGASFERHDEGGWSYGLAWSPDGSMVASSRESGILQVWDAGTGKELALLEGHTNPVWGLAWSSDGLRLASASDDESVCLWGVR